VSQLEKNSESVLFCFASYHFLPVDKNIVSPALYQNRLTWERVEASGEKEPAFLRNWGEKRIGFLLHICGDNYLFDPHERWPYVRYIS
jgi:hypothetical protein